MHSLSRKVKIIILSLIAAVLIAALAVTIVLILFKNHPVPANVGSDYIAKKHRHKRNLPITE